MEVDTALNKQTGVQMKRGNRVYSVWVEDEKTYSKWGMLGGKMQVSIDWPGPKGVPGTKSFVNAAQSARDLMIQRVAKKAREGWKTVTYADTNIENAVKAKLGEGESSEEISFNGPLPTNLCFSKPVNTISQKDAKALLDQSRGVFTVKINGMLHIISKDKNENVFIQTRGKMKVVNDKYPHLVNAFAKTMPPESIALAELFYGEGATMPEFETMKSISNSLPDRAIELQKELGWVSAYVIRVPYWGGVFVEDCHTIGRTFTEINQTYFPQKDYGDGLIVPIEYFNCSYEAALKDIELGGYEGLVLYDSAKYFGYEGYNFKGIPDRPKICWKIKASYEDDFVGIFDPNGPGKHCSSKCNFNSKEWHYFNGRCPVCNKKLLPNGSFGTGKNRERVGCIALYQYNTNNELIYICDVSGGLTDQDKEDWAFTYVNNGEEEIRETLKIESKGRSYRKEGAESNALTFPTFITVRNDKKCTECINPLL
jgi:hypothetical protein